MLLFFWSLTVGLLVLVISLLFPWIARIRGGFFIFGGVGVVVYSVYFVLGSSQQLREYYSLNQPQRARMQPLMLQLKKQEYRLRFYLDEHPSDNLARSQLLEILGIQALQAGEKDLARQCLQEALLQITKTDLLERKQHLQVMLENLKPD